ncbi:MAG: MetQ/NlpA family ABC transporter substrate-binding protein [Fusobacteriaceae bacterium]|jgi:D-methionine transport system substrate-binding protein|nr:MetQ/NlpA family ABC transporter substrate-binding protein [Fusobacteriaceae bacterium]
MKKIILLSLLITSVLFAKPVKIGVTPIPNPDVLEFIREDLKKEGIEIEIIVFSDYTTPNIALAEGALDANAFQHIPFLNTFKKDKNYDLTEVGVTFVSPIALFSKKYKTLEAIPAGAEIAIPNDATNGGRALILLHDKGVIKLKDPTNLLATPLDIVENPKNYKITELEAPQLPRVLGDVDAAVINANYAVEAGLSPTDDNIIIEDANSPYVNVFAVRTPDKDREDIKKIVKAYQTEKVRKFILETFKGAYVPVF